MRQWVRRARVHMTAVLLALVAFGALSPVAPVVGQTPSTPTPVPVVWVAYYHGLAVIVPRDDATVVWQMSDWVNEPLRGHSVATDDERGLVWLYGADPSWTYGVLSAYDFSGQLIRRIPTTVFPHCTGRRLVRVDHRDGSVWINGGDTLQRFSADGQLLTSIPTSEGGACAFDIDPLTGRVWVGRQELRALDMQSGQLLQEINIGSDVWVQGLEVEPGTGQIWVLSTERLLRYAASGQEEVNLPQTSQPASPDEFLWGLVRDGGGGVWFVHDLSTGDSRLRRFVPSTQSVVDVADVPHTYRQLTADPRDQSVWVLTNGYDVRHFDTAGNILH